MRTREREVVVPVVLAVPSVASLLWGLVLVVAVAAVIAMAVANCHFSSGDSTVPTTPGPCAPFCAVRSDSAPLPQGGEQR